MIHHKRPDNGVLKCCGAKVTATISIPFNCSCDETLTTLIEACEYRGELTGDVVKCGCPGNVSQPIYFCAKKGRCIKRAADNRPKAVEVCLGCDVIRPAE